MGEIKIEENIPIPKYKWTGLVKKMKANNSVVVKTKIDAAAFRTAAYRLGRKVTTRKTTDGIRVWLL